MNDLQVALLPSASLFFQSKSKKVPKLILPFCGKGAVKLNMFKLPITRVKYFEPSYTKQ